jgi:2-polyprenyl-6-hydroxyphenyl methylase/3-demethylubiquinone-9 3-methyltransferase
MKENYYAKSLNAGRLYDVYDTKLAKVKAYLDAEISFVKKNLQKTDNVLELGVGYGRIIKELAPCCKSITGIDISTENVAFGEEYLSEMSNVELSIMDALEISPKAFESSFEAVLCMQNAFSSMKVEPFLYVEKIMGLLSHGGRAWISTYSEKFWQYRVDWFLEQAEKGLLGEIDHGQTKDGVIVCKDGFRSTALSLEQLKEIGEFSGFPYEIHEVDESSVFLVIEKT